MKSCTVEGSAAETTDGPWQKWTRRLLAGLTLITCAASVGCGTKYYRNSADKEVYSIIAAKAAKVFGMDSEFRLNEDIPGYEQPEIVKMALEGTAPPLTLADAVTIATANNRDYVSQREDVYVAALALTAARFAWKPQLSGVLSGLYEDNSGDRSVSGSTSFGLEQALSTGGNLGLSLSSNFLRFLTGDPRVAAASTIQATLSQPLWRGAGKTVAMEPLTQAERDMIYALRSFVLYRNDFYVQIASAYYRVLQQEDTVVNSQNQFDQAKATRERAEMTAQAGRTKDYELGQAQQRELSARDVWLRAQENYENALDSFKITLGLPVTSQITLDKKELEELMQVTAQVALNENELENPGPASEGEHRRTPEEQAQLATKGRLDLMTAFDRMDDADRKIVVAADNLNPDVTLFASASQSTPPTQPTTFNGDIYNYQLGPTIALPLNMLNERNAYRASLIAKNRTVRSYTLLRDQVRQQIYDDWRGLVQSRQSCAISKKSVDLADRQVENTSISQQAGRATMRDVLDAQSSLLVANLALTGALVDYRITQLTLWRDTGTLAFIDGRFQEDTSHVESVPDSN
jgi:outer membrane protein TolC